jgi:hypothetical protein
MRDVRHPPGFLADLPLDIALVRESIHKRTEYEASCLLTRAGAAMRCTDTAISVNN